MASAKPSGTSELLPFMQSVWGLVHALDVQSKRMEQRIGVTGPQRLVIRIVGQQPDQTASEIAAALGKHPSTLTGVLARLEQRGLIARASDAADRRRARFTLTTAGKKIDREKKGTVEAAIRRVLGRADHGSVRHTLETLQQLISALEDER